MSDEESGSDKDSFVYQDSSSEAEEWDDDQEWVVNDINDEYHPPRGPRYLKFDWDRWERADGTSHTWEREGSVATRDARRTVKAFDTRRAREEAEAAKDCTITPYYPYKVPQDEDDNDADQEDIDMTKQQKHKKPDYVYLFTEVSNQAREMFVDAKLRQLTRRPTGFSEALVSAEEMFTTLRQERQQSLSMLNISIYEAVEENLLGLGPAVMPSNANRPRVKTQAEMQQRMSSLNIREIPLSFQKNVPSSTASPPSMATTSTKVDIPAVHSKPTKVDAPTMSSKSSVVDTPTTSSQSTKADAAMMPSQFSIVTAPHLSHSLRHSLQALWSRIARLSGAARITFSNEVSDDDIPPIDINTFKYLERTYLYEHDIPRPDPGFFHSCGCSPGSCQPETCACQEDSIILDANNNKVFMYDSNGLYVFDRNVSSYVFECNEKCSCGPNCPSRVAQKPRNIPIDIFRTTECGWGVRTSVDIPKGTILGLYTGTLLERVTAREIPAEDAKYLCDLDFHEDVIGNEKGYTVNAHTSGNWTRFVNHSCNPTCMLYAVIYDSIPEIHQPKLALVAKKFIPAFTEITLDYSPNASKRGKGKQKVTEGTLECHCGTEGCRGYIY